MATFMTVIKVLLPILSIVGILGTWVLASTNGTLQLMERVGKDGTWSFHGERYPLKSTFTGIRGIDDQLKVLVIFFLPVVDGSAPSTSLQSLHFGGQLVAAYTLCMIESLRMGNRGKIISFMAIWGLIFQNVTFAVTMPLYMALHLSTSPTVLSPRDRPVTSASHLRVPRSQLDALPWSILLGFIVPTLLLCFPPSTGMTFSLRQNLIAFWQAFPLWTSLWQMFLTASLKGVSPMSGIFRRSAADQAIVPKSLRNLYLFAFGFSAALHVATVSISLASVLNPAMFATGYAALLKPSRVFLPISFFSKLQVSSIGEGALYLLQWDELVGSTALVLWALALYRNAHDNRFGWQDWASVTAKVLGLTVTAGPCSAAISLIWKRDELIWSQESTREKAIR